MNIRFELFVANIEKSCAFYRDVLGFKELQSYKNYHPVLRDNVIIGLGLANGLNDDHYFQPEITSQRKGLGIEIVLEVDDIDEEYKKIQQANYPIAEELKKQEWGLTDFRLVDPDGYYLRITAKT